MKPLFIVFEGPDGCGKSTASAALVAALSTDHFPVWLTAEPTRSPLGLLARKRLTEASVLDDAESEVRVSLRAEALGLFFADRLQHLRGIQARMNEGQTVVCDRYALSTWAYQLMDLDPDPATTLKMACGSVRTPDLTVLVQTDEADLLRRIGERPAMKSGGADPVETEVLVRRHAHAYRTFADGLRPAYALRADLYNSGLERHPYVPGLFLRVPGESPTGKIVARVREGMSAVHRVRGEVQP